jgi:outer membrane protein assembly factor BamB
MSVSEDAEVVPGMVWNGIHRDARNSDTVTTPLRRPRRTESHVLAGRTILFGPSVRADGQRYATTGQGAPGPRVHIVSADGEPIDGHEADRSRPSPRVCTDVPLFVGSDRFVVSDDRHTWCFDPDGRLLWSTDLVELGAVGGPVSSIATQQGFVGGVTMEGQVVLLDPESGAPVHSVFDLRAGAGFSPPPATPGLWAGDMMDADTAALIEPAFFGFGHPVTSSPAVGPDNGLLYVSAVAAANDASELIALDVSGSQVEVVARTPIAGRCTSSPSVSADGRLVYTVDGSGLVYALDAQDGGVSWTVPGGGAAASPAIGPDGTVYSAGTGPGSALLAIDGGEVRWRRSFDELAGRHLPSRQVAPMFPHPDPIGTVNSVQTVGPDALLVVVALGYGFRHPESGAGFLQPHRSLLVTVDTTDGTILDEVELRDTSEAVVVAEPDGTVHVCHAALLTSLAATLDPFLPEHLRTPLRPIGGITTLRPA